MDEQKPRRRRRQPQINQEHMNEINPISIEDKEETEETETISTIVDKKRNTFILVVFRIIAVFSIILVAACLYYDMSPVFSSTDEMKEKIQGIYLRGTDYFLVENNTIQYVDVFEYADTVQKWEIIEVNPSTGIIKARLTYTDYYKFEKVGDVYEFTVRKNAEYINRGNYYGGMKRKGDAKKVENWIPGPIRTPTPSPRPPETMNSALEIKDLQLYHERNYAYVTGAIRNTGNRTYKYVKVRAVLKNEFNSVVDTDWTYAVGSEGIRPDEEKKFELMIKDTKEEIQKVSVSIMD